MRNAREIPLTHTENAVRQKKTSNSSFDKSLRFKGNLIAYRQEFASIPSANSNSALRSSKETLLQRYNAKRARLVFRPIQSLFSAAPPSNSLPEVNRTQREPANRIQRDSSKTDSWISTHGKFIAAVAGSALVGVAVGSSGLLTEKPSSATASVPSQSDRMTNQQPQTSDGNPSSSEPSGVISEAATGVSNSISGGAVTGGISIDALKKRVVESERAAAGYREEVALLRDRTSSLTIDNEALVAETLGLNRELTDLLATVTELQEKQASGINIETRVVYNFVNVPIGSDPNTASVSESYDTAIGGQEIESSYNNTPDVFKNSSGNNTPFNTQENSTRSTTDEASEEALDELLDSMAEDGLD